MKILQKPRQNINCF